jgi:hypothetical protein
VARLSLLARSSGEEFAMSTRTYYRGPDAVVTDKFLVWRTTPTKGFVVRDLRNVGLVRCPEADRSRPYTVHVAGGVLILAIAMWTVLDSPAAYIAGGLAVAIPAFVALASARRRPQRWELRATYRGTRVVIYASTNDRVFGQVTRALRRSVEDARPPSDDHDLAAA